ncbi:MAG: GAF domain-containing protein, partial [Deltaproteobacteria bacterium]
MGLSHRSRRATARTSSGIARYARRHSRHRRGRILRRRSSSGRFARHRRRAFSLARGPARPLARICRRRRGPAPRGSLGADREPRRPRLLDTLLEESPGIDCAALLDSSLIVREASGLERGFVGCVAPAGALDEEVARTRMGLSVRDAVTDPRLARSAVAQSGIRALHVVPLLDRGVLLGILHAGSRTAYELSPLELSLVRTAATRATDIVEMEASTAEAHRLLALQDELARTLSEARTVEEAMKGALSALCQHLGFDVGL